MKSIHYIIYIAFAALSFTACQEDEFFADYGEGTGTLTLSGIEVVSEVGDIQTRASMNDADIPSADEFTIELLDANTQEFVQELELDKRYTLEAGSYIIKASCGEECVISATPYFCGERKLTIADGDAKTITISPSLCCAIIQPRIAEDLAAQYESYTLTIIGNVDGEEPESATLTSGEDFYLACGEDKTYSLTLAGKNKLGKEVSHTWTYSDLAERTRYIVNCNPDLPSFSLPEQAETNAWSKFIYVTPVTAENFSYIPEGMTADEILANMVYEVSADGQTWNPAITDNDKIVFTSLTPSTEYTIRARFGGVNSDNTAILTTENAKPLEYGNMDTWYNNSYRTYGLQTIYLYYVGEESSNKFWGTRNPLTMNGVEGGTWSGTENQITAYRWNSCTIQTDDAVSGSAAEIRTMALANFNINSGAAGVFGGHSDMVQNVLNNASVYIGYLYTGTTDMNSWDEPDQYGINHDARPQSLSFNYKYAPYGNDEFTISAILYDQEKNEIAHAEFSSSNQQDTYLEETLEFQYENTQAKPASLFVIFKSGKNNSINDVQNIEGNYSGAFGIKNPWPDDTFVGSVLKIDNVVLNYDYE